MGIHGFCWFLFFDRSGHSNSHEEKEGDLDGSAFESKVNSLFTRLISLIVIAKIGADESTEIGFIPTIQLEEYDLPRSTFIPFNFSQESAKATREEALRLAEIEALRLISARYPKGTRYRIEKE